MRYALILKNGTLVTTNKSFKADVGVTDGKIAFVGKIEKTDSADSVYDCEGKHVLPGVIDAHVHFREPGLCEKEDFQSGSAAAAFGGVTTVADMPNVVPVTSTTARFMEKAALAREKSFVDFALFALLTNDNIEEIESLKKAGALGFKVFLGSSTGEAACPPAGVLYEQMRRAGLRIGFHCEDSELNSHFTKIYKEKTGTPDGVTLSLARPEMSEALAANAAVCYAKYTGARVHIHHVTSKAVCEIVLHAKEKRINLTAETCPHYLLLDAKDGAHKVYPPVREGERENLLRALTFGVIDTLASDHAPHTKAEKKLSLWQAPAGLCGVETFVPLMLNEVNEGRLDLNDFVRASSEAPARIWGLYPRKGCLSAGADGDFTIVDMNKTGRIEAQKLHSKNKTSAFDGKQIKGCVQAAIVRGVFVMKDGVLTGKRGFGELVSPAS